MKKVLISQSNYIPWKGYFDAISLVDEFIIYDEMQYTKRDWRNRNKIKTAQGLKWLTIPVEVKGKYLQKINETKVSDKNWNVKHWNLLKENYSKTLFFKENKDFFEELYLNLNHKYLTEINYKFISAICHYFNITTTIKFSSDYELKGNATEKLMYLCKDLNAEIYYSGPAAKNYLDESIFNTNNIKVEYLDYSNYKEYIQLHAPFRHDVTILDLIFNVGKNASQFLKYI
ncbi:WbqC family protein [Polaribacter sp. KT 15]|uniref:WbqC family protein n=1 Tax=Polaribacter sp. KT 15 TaxID=1896175 RepID=UPI00090CCB99|nr:WbqC family protein [Polaribacter sp. KT 15]SHN09894.1 WbqC-like protein family protein [Polaribacter sp. KT 15]